MEELNVRDKRKDTICAPATPHGESAIGMVRVSGSDAVTIVDEMFVTKEIKTGILRNAKAGTMKHGLLLDSNKNIIDEVICSVFLAPNSYTGENVVEISHHGSVYVQQQIIISVAAHGGIYVWQEYIWVFCWNTVVLDNYSRGDVWRCG